MYNVVSLCTLEYTYSKSTVWVKRIQFLLIFFFRENCQYHNKNTIADIPNLFVKPYTHSVEQKLIPGSVIIKNRLIKKRILFNMSLEHDFDTYQEKWHRCYDIQLCCQDGESLY